MAVASDPEGTLTPGESWRGLGRYLNAHGRAADYRRFLWPRLPGDTAADVPMLLLGDKPVAVYPDPELRRYARDPS